VDGKQAGSPPMRKPGTLVEDLAMGQQVDGTIKRITDFGAFVDVGVGRDGMIHISELQLGSVEKVSDVVQEGQKVTVWVKEVDSKKNRISLTMVNPDRKRISDLVVGSTVEGTVTRMAPYGAFVDIGSEREAMIHVKEMGDEYIKNPSDVVKPGDKINARILTLDKRRRRIDLTMKEEEEIEDVAEMMAEAEEEAEELPTLMELRLKEAMERQEKKERKGKKRKERTVAPSDVVDDIISRTLESHRNES